MTGFFIKKAFFDGWDNLLSIISLNVTVLGVAFGGFYLAGSVSGIPPLSVGILVLAVLAEGVLLLAISKLMARVAAYKSFTFRDLLAALRESLLHGALFALLMGAAALTAAVAIPYYLSLGNVIGFALGVLMFWVAVAFVLSMQWFLPVRSQLEDRFWKAVKKSAIIFFDNPGFSLFMFLYTLVVTALSTVLVFMLPGVTGMILAHNEAFRLRMFKYDWLEAHPELDPVKARRHIPWSEILAEEEETVGTRSLRSFIFPWKD